MNKKFLLFGFLILSVFFTTKAIVVKNKKNVDWEAGFHKSIDSEQKESYPATVPGAVQLDYANTVNRADHNLGENRKDYPWMEDVF